MRKRAVIAADGRRCTGRERGRGPGVTFWQARSKKTETYGGEDDNSASARERSPSSGDNREWTIAMISTTVVDGGRVKSKVTR